MQSNERSNAMKYITIIGIWCFLFGGATLADEPTILGAILFLGGLVTAYFSSQFWDWEDIV